LRVTASTSVFAFRGRQIDVRRIADSLRVANILEGDVQKIGSHLRVHVRLVDALDGSTRWSETYDRELRDVFLMQDDIARSVAGELDVRLVGRTGTARLRHQTHSIAAYEFYLRGRDPTLLRSDSSVRLGLEYFRRALAADSTFAAAWAGLAHMYGVLGLGGKPGRPLRELAELAEAAARKAVALDDSLAEAHVELGFVRVAGLRDLASAERELRHGLELDPGIPRAHEYLSELYAFTGRPVEALAEARRGQATDSLSAIATAQVAKMLYINGRFDEALVLLQTLAAVRPPLRRVANTAGLCYVEKRMWPEAVAALQAAAANGGPRALALLGYTLARAGQREEARRIQVELLARWRRNVAGASEIAMVHAGLGDLDQAFVWLERAADDRSLALEWMGPTFSELRDDPRFLRIIRRLGLQNR
jgi:serine/threonine-protein kinase